MQYLNRLNPMLECKTSTLALGYAPSPWELKQCTETGFVYLANPPTYEAFVSEFAWEKTSQNESKNRQKAEPVLYAGSVFVKRFRAKILKRNKFLDLCIHYTSLMGDKEIKMLDLGCGSGALLGDVMSSLPLNISKKCSPYGVELSRELAAIANNNLNKFGGQCVHETALDGLAKFPSCHFQLITLASFLEHEINPLPLLRDCHRTLADGGFLIVKVPNYASANLKMRGAKWCGFRWPDHVNYFTPKTLTLMAKKAGFVLERMNVADTFLFSDSLYAVFKKPNQMEVEKSF